MTRYTYNSLKADLPALNAKLDKLGHKYRFVPGHRYGYAAIDLATLEQIKEYGVHTMLEGGTPKECLAACHKYISAQI